MSSFISPVRPIGSGVPWDWNPAATFQTAFNNAREEQRAQQEFEMKMDMERILFPLKIQTAQMNFEKLVQDRDRTMLLNDQIREARRNASIGINSALSSGVGETGQQDDQQQLGYSNRLKKTSEVGTLGSGLQPLKPPGGN